MILTVKRRMPDSLSFWVLFELTGGDKLPLGNTGCFGSILGVLGFSGMIIIGEKGSSKCW